MLAPLKHLPGYLIRRVSSQVLSELSERLEPYKLRAVDASVLLVLEANPRTTQSELGRMLGVLRANMTPLVAVLEERGLLRREPVDRRSQGLVLTARGATLTAKVRRTVEAYERTILQRIPPAHRASFMAALQALWQEEE